MFEIGRKPDACDITELIGRRGRNGSDRQYWKIYAMRVEQNVMVKTLDLLANGLIRVLSQNKSDDPDYCIEPEDLELLGQVIWCSREPA
jgi:adenylate cyclase